MSEFVYQCILNTDHPRKRMLTEPVIPPCCCGRPMVLLPASVIQKEDLNAGIYACQSITKPEKSRLNTILIKSSSVSPEKKQLKRN